MALTQSEQLELSLQVNGYLFGISFGCGLAFAVSDAIVLYSYGHEPCDTPLKRYLIMYLVMQCVELLLNVAQFRKARACHLSSMLAVWSLWVAFGELAVWILGNVWWFNADTCADTNSHVYKMAQALLITGYFTFCLPVLIMLLMCCCLPCIRHHEQSTAASVLRALESQLPVRLFGAENPEEEQCVICFEVYGATDEVYTLPCQHEIHKACADTWFSHHTTCPLCRLDVSQALIPESLNIV